MILNARRREGLLVVDLALGRLALGGLARDGGDVERRRQVVDDGVEQRLDALVLERGAVEDRYALTLDGAGAQRLLDVGGGDLLLADELLEDVLVERREDVDELTAVVARPARHVGGDVDDVELGAELLARPHDGLHLDEVDDALVLGLGADRQLHDRGVVARGAPGWCAGRR